MADRMTKSTAREIVVGIIRSEKDAIFITQRGERSHLAGFWEFPGGKIEPNETPEHALRRELAEEIDIQVRSAIFLKTIHHKYSDREVRLHVYLIEDWDGQPFGKEGQHSRWVPQSQLNVDDFPAANLPIIEMLKNFDL